MAGAKCSRKVAETAASRLFRNVKCKNYLAELAAKSTAKSLKTAEDVIAELEKLAFSNMGDYVKFDKYGVEVTDSSKLTSEQLAAIQEVSEVETTRGSGKRKTKRRYFKFKLHDKKGSLEILARKFNLLKDRNIEVNIGAINFNENRPPPKCTKQSKPK